MAVLKIGYSPPVCKSTKSLSVRQAKAAGHSQKEWIRESYIDEGNKTVYWGLYCKTVWSGSVQNIVLYIYICIYLFIYDVV